MISRGVRGIFAAAAVLAFNTIVAQAAPFMIVGNDEKQAFDDSGKTILSLPGKEFSVNRRFGKPA